VFKEDFQEQLASRFRLDAIYQKNGPTLHKATFLNPRFSHEFSSFVTGATKALAIEALQNEIGTVMSTSTAISKYFSSYIIRYLITFRIIKSL